MKDQFKNRIRIYALLFLAFLMVFSPCLSVRAEEGQPLKKVRVGYLIYPGYQDGAGDAPKSGYGYEYLQQIGLLCGLGVRVCKRQLP